MIQIIVPIICRPTCNDCPSAQLRPCRLKVKHTQNDQPGELDSIVQGSVQIHVNQAWEKSYDLMIPL